MRNDFNYWYGNLIASGTHLSLMLVGFRLGTRGGWLFCLSLIGAVSLVSWTANFRRSRAVADTPTSRVASAPQGYVELFGEARLHPRQTLKSPVSARPCVWFRYLVEEGSGKDWHRVAGGMSTDTFLLGDNTGQAIIDPDNAEIITTEHRTWHDGVQRYSEWLLAPARPLYVLGELCTQGGAASVLDPTGDLSVLLNEWKANKAGLLKRFDLDHNGEIDLKEWQLARQAARREVTKQHQDLRSQPGVNIVRKPRDGRLFLLSNLDPDKLRQRYGFWTAFQLVTALAAAAGLLFVLTSFATR